MLAPPYAALVLLSPLLFPHPAMIAKIRFQLLTSVHVRVTWAGFDKLELGAVTFKHVLLLGYRMDFKSLMLMTPLISVNWFQSLMVQLHSYSCFQFLESLMVRKDSDPRIPYCWLLLGMKMTSEYGSKS